MRTNRLLAATTLSVTAIALLAACGPEKSGGADAAAPASTAASPRAASSAPTGPTPDEIVAKARAAGAKLGSVKITFTQAAPTGKASGVLSVDRAGNCVGTMTIEGSGGGQVIRNSSGDLWLKPDAEFISTLDVPDAAATLGDDWFLYPKETGAGADYARFCDLALPIQETAGQAAFEGAVTAGGKALPMVVDGVNILGFKLFEGNKAGAPVLFSGDGEPRLLSLETDNNSSMKFSEFDQPVRAVPPPSDEVIRTGK
ncbi:hypothetical protein [Kitasatospora sp. NPDC057198]|uniref:hypothetical protein n=1 Tax=Kitasatospora sp. NPDC057198 TaxID=3346046 RepID=UPI00362ADAAF